MNQSFETEPPAHLTNDLAYDLVIRDLALMLPVGCYASEKKAPQPVILTVRLTVSAPFPPSSDALDQVADYGGFVEKLMALEAEDHTQLLETLAHKIATLAFEDARVEAIDLTLEKPEIVPAAKSVGIQLSLTRVEYQDLTNVK